MPDSFEDQEWVKFGVAAALSREYEKDQRLFLEMLAKTLQQALPGETEITQRGFLKKTLAGVSVTLGDNRYSFEDPGNGSIKATRTHFVRGIALKNEPVAVDEALADMGAALEERTAHNARAREALAKMLGLS